MQQTSIIFLCDVFTEDWKGTGKFTLLQGASEKFQKSA